MKALQKMKTALFESGRLREGSATTARSDHSEGGAPFVPALADAGGRVMDWLPSSAPQGNAIR